MAVPLARRSTDLLSAAQAGSDILDYSILADTLHWRGSSAATDRPESAVPSAAHVHVIAPAYDYVAPELISLFVTDTGGYTPSYVYRLLAEYYSAQDYRLTLQP